MTNGNNNADQNNDKPMGALTVDQYIQLRDSQKDLDAKVTLIDGRLNDTKKEQEKILSIIEWVRQNMSTKEEIQTRYKSVDELENDLKTHVKETNHRLDEMGKDNQKNVVDIQKTFSTTIDSLKSEIFQKFDMQATKAGNNMVKTALLTGKFSIVYAIIAMLLSSLIGGAIALFFTHAR